ncbi:MAG: hypothetical protein HFE93_00115 [Acutalibacter muris]|nr:hypothetical protein [Acutalibacter muris]
MGAAREILLGLLEGFRGAMPEVEFREALNAKEGFRPAGRVLVLGAVQKESEQGDQWSAKLAFTVYAPRGRGLQETIDGMAGLAKGSQPLLSGVERGAAALDRGTGALAAGCVFSFYKPGSSGGSEGKKVRYPVEINGGAYTVTGWRVSVSGPGGSLTAIGESEPFYYKGGREFTIELQGLDMEGPEGLGAFTLRLGGQGVMYTDCRWKSLSAGGNGTLSAGDRTAVEEV